MKTKREPGTVTIEEKRYRICGECGAVVKDFYAIYSDSGFLCSYLCPADGSFSRPKDFYAIYKVTKEYLRNEAIKNLGASSNG